MGCGCNQPSDYWRDLEWVKATAQKVADIKQSEQTVFKVSTGYLFNDSETYKGTEIVCIIQPKQ
jgi:hypothetical protein